MWSYIQQNPYEVGGFVTSLICVWLNARENVWGWGWAIISALLSAKLFYDLRLFGDMYLQFFFVLSAIYGVYAWLYVGKEVAKRTIAYTPPQTILLACVSGASIFLCLIVLLAKQKGDAIYMDALTTSISIIAQLMMARKYIENWWLWIVANILYVGLYAYKGVWLYVILYTIFIVLAVYGYKNWLKSLKITQVKTTL